MISIIIPTYNRAHLVKRAVKSILRQSCNDWEIIIVDDGSTDKTENAIYSFLKDQRVNLIKKENSGAAHSRNVGVERAKGEYITFLDSDDEAKPEWLERLNEEIVKSRPDLICCGAERIDHKGNLIEMILPEPKKEFFGKVEYRMTNGGVFAMKKEVFQKTGGYDADLRSGQHTELSLRVIPFLLKNNGKIVNIRESLIKIHVHKGERIRGNTEAKYLGSKRTLELHKSFFDQRLKAKSDYSGVVAYNASKLGLKKEALKYAIIAFKAQPSLVRMLRIFKYSL